MCRFNLFFVSRPLHQEPSQKTMWRSKFFSRVDRRTKNLPRNHVAGKVCRTVSLVETGTHVGMHAAETFGQKTVALVGTS